MTDSMHHTGYSENCQCEHITQLDGVAAERYVKNHLERVRADAIKWEIEYRCPDTGITWVMDFPHSEWHGGGPPRLRKLARTLEELK